MGWIGGVSLGSLNWWRGTSWLVEQIDVRPRRVELSWRGSPDACLSASEWTGIYYLSPLPTIKPIMSCFNSLGKQAYRSHVSINVNYPGSCPHLRVHQPPQSWPRLLQHGIQYVWCQCCIKWGMWCVLSRRLRLPSQVWGEHKEPSAGSSGFFIVTDIDLPMDQCQITTFHTESWFSSFASRCINRAFVGRGMNY